jgi:DNA-binding beta-propeller fold protein YncE
MAGIRRSTLALSVVLTAALTACSSGDAFREPLTAKTNIQLPADASRSSYDLLTLDTRNGHLYAAHTSSGTVEMVDVKTDKLAASIPNLPDVKSIALSSDPNVIFAATGASATVRVVDVAQRKVINEITVRGGPDALAYDPNHDIILAALNSNNLAFIDATKYKLLSTISLPGAPELIAVDPKAGRAFLAINDKDEVVVIDTGTQQITSTYRGCDIVAPSGVAYDPDQGHLFIAGRTVMSIIDVVLDRCLGTVDIGSGADQVAIDPHTHHLYVANAGSRNLSVIDTLSFKPFGVVGTGPSAHGVAVDPTTDKVYVVVGRAGAIAVFHDP